MATIRLPGQIWEKARNHLLGEPGEHFAFFLANWTFSVGEPVFLIQDVILIPDEKLLLGCDGYSLDLETILLVINTAVKGNFCIIEAHNHGGEDPGFSDLDREELQDFVPYVLDSLRERPYAATVWGDTTVFGMYFLPDGKSGKIGSITVTNYRLMQIVSEEDDDGDIDVYDRQLPWFGVEGQRQLGRIRAGVIGCGGLGAQVIQNLVYLGSRDFALVDDDSIEDTNLNRLVTATPADIGTPKVIAARRLIRSLAKEAKVLALNESLRSKPALDALKGVDVLFGCVDNDGARLILNELALAYGIPYFDLAVGIQVADGLVTEAGGRVAVVTSEGPCLYCMGEIDPHEAGYFLVTPEQQRVQIQRGYISGLDAKAPAVVSLNGLVAAAAVNEFAVLISGIRPITFFIDYDLLGIGRQTKSQYLTPVSKKKNDSCVECAYRGIGDQAILERYLPHL
jgi:molybdopterin/thiamine biosynthesis adenylyltransferase